jgi:ethanolamine utilization protein EutN
MLLGQVVGNVTATRKQAALTGQKFLVIRTEGGHTIVAVDLMGAGPDEQVIIATGRAARIAMGKDDLPVDAAVVGIVD